METKAKEPATMTMDTHTKAVTKGKGIKGNGTKETAIMIMAMNIPIKAMTKNIRARVIKDIKLMVTKVKARMVQYIFLNHFKFLLFVMYRL